MIWTIANRLLMGEMTGDICCFRLPRHHSFLPAVHPDVPSPTLSSWGSGWTVPTTWLLEWVHDSGLAIREFHAAGHGHWLIDRWLTQARLMRIQEVLLPCWGKDAYIVPIELNSGTQVALSMKRSYLKLKPTLGRTGPKGEWQCPDSISENRIQLNALNFSVIWVILVLSVSWVPGNLVHWQPKEFWLTTPVIQYIQRIVKQACADIALPLCLPKS